MNIILASQSGVRKKILDKYNIDNEVIVSNVDPVSVLRQIKKMPRNINLILINYLNPLNFIFYKFCKHHKFLNYVLCI